MTEAEIFSFQSLKFLSAMISSSHSPLLELILETVTRLGMWTPGQKLLLAVSGGSDSMALLHSLMDLRSLYSADFGLIHLNHGLRSEADEEEAFVEKTAKSLSLPFFSKKVDLRQTWPDRSVEEAGRMARYDFFHDILKREGYDRIVTAHHADDRAEQILMNLVRGCGPEGLSGIPAVHGKIVRPLICLRKEELIAYLKGKGIQWREDPSNKDLRFLRNRVRHKLLPLLEKDFNPTIRKTLLQMGDMALEDKWFWLDLAEKSLQDLILEKENTFLKLSIEKLKELKPALQARVIRQALEEIKGDLLSIRKNHVEAVRSLLAKNESKDLHFPGRIKLTFSSGILEIRKMPHSLRRKDQKTGI